jgi:hypothetical protein
MAKLPAVGPRDPGESLETRCYLALLLSPRTIIRVVLTSTVSIQKKKKKKKKKKKTPPLSPARMDGISSTLPHRRLAEDERLRQHLASPARRCRRQGLAPSRAELGTNERRMLVGIVGFERPQRRH